MADRLYKLLHLHEHRGHSAAAGAVRAADRPRGLVKAVVAGGIDISTAIADLSAPLPLYRFNVLLQRATEVCGDVKALGMASPSALEKKEG